MINFSGPGGQGVYIVDAYKFINLLGHETSAEA
jgi:hypothetical protein